MIFRFDIVRPPPPLLRHPSPPIIWNWRVPVRVDLSKLSNVVKNDVLKKDVYNAKIKKLKAKYLTLLT